MKQKSHKLSRSAKVRIIALIVSFLLGVVFLIAFLYCGRNYLHKKINCTNTIYGTVTNAHIWKSGSGRRSHHNGSADLVVETDGVFPSCTLPIDSYYYAQLDAVRIYYDPDDPKLYYLDRDLTDYAALVVVWGVFCGLFFLLFGFGLKTTVRSIKAERTDQQ